MKTAFKLRLMTGIVALAFSLLPVRHLRADAAALPSDLPVEQAVLTSPPDVPPTITRNHPAKVVVNLEVREQVMRLADGVTYNFWTFGGTVPGRFIRVREGDLVEFHLSNASDSKMPHNIDLHAVVGPGGGATASFTAPGHTSVFSFAALNPGLYVYHCAMAPVGMHVADGMYGLIFVQPKDGMPKVDHEYYVMQGEVYTTGTFGDPGLQMFDLNKALDERPPYVVFNGAVGSLTDSRALTARVGDTVRIYFGNGGPNLDSAFHVVGVQFEALYQDGTMTNVLRDVQTILVPPGSAAVADFKVEVPGVYSLVDHSIFRAFNKGALGQLSVTGPENKQVYSGKLADMVYQDIPADDTNMAVVAEPPKPVAATEIASTKMAGTQFANGQRVFNQICFACHQVNGQGMPGVFPRLARSDFLMADKNRSIGVVLKGLNGAVTVDSSKFVGSMPPLATLSDQQIADVLTYVRNSWGNSGEAVSAEEVHQVRQSPAPETAEARAVESAARSGAFE
ncbi:MAG TPA: copper-containing nitrite reductase [Verrucomicrobiae bacterium]|nr:copper-containing nitrite reductase [Verrucomicrobiae bacterium]